jgi:hypothetical protein
MITNGLRTLQQQFQSHLLYRDEQVAQHIAGTRRVDNRTRSASTLMPTACGCRRPCASGSTRSR